MKIFISRVPKQTSRKELRTFVEDGLNSGLRKLPMFTCAAVSRCEIVHMVDDLTGVAEYHGLVEIDSSKPVGYVLERLIGKKLHGKPMSLHEYRKRTAVRDRRTVDIDTSVLKNSERRESDRRRSHLRASTGSSIQTQAMYGFHQVHN
ncbi:MAG: hypothetical protein ABW078_00005 [Sedimenticola sp.]